LARASGRSCLENHRYVPPAFPLQLLHGVFLPPLCAAQASAPPPQLFLPPAYPPPQPHPHHPPPHARRHGSELRREFLPDHREGAKGSVFLSLVHLHHFCGLPDPVFCAPPL